MAIVHHSVDFLTRYTEYTMRKVERNAFPIIDSFTLAWTSVCLLEITASATATDMGSKNAIFHANGIDRETVVFCMLDLYRNPVPRGSD